MAKRLNSVEEAVKVTGFALGAIPPAETAERREPALPETLALLALLASGVPLPAVSARLGHGSIRTTQEIYSHMIHGQDDEAARKWEEFQNRPAGGEPQQKGVICKHAPTDPAAREVTHCPVQNRTVGSGGRGASPYRR